MTLTTSVRRWAKSTVLQQYRPQSNPINTRFFSNSEHRKYTDVILRIPKANVFRYGDGDRKVPIFEDLDWTINEGENWAIVGSAGNEKAQLLEVKVRMTRRL